ncbi:MAG: dynamin family protein [Acidobacteriaceae bacterium]
MPERDQNSGMARHGGKLNANQQRRLRISCQYIDKLLSDIEDILHEATSESAFPRHVVDVSLAQIRVLEDYIRRIRSQLVHAIAWQNMKPEPSDIPATRALLSYLTFIDIAIEELKPKYMRGYGAVPEDAVDELNGVVHELRSAVDGMQGYLKQELGTNLDQRLQQLEKTGYDVGLLRLLEQIATRNGLVEFRPRIDALAARMEDDSFEVALFGRVSSGKSSLLNALLGTDVLPVGINPITAVPTKLRYGTALKAAVSYGDGRSELVSIEQLGHLVTEQGNPGNLKNVVRALVEVPSSRLKEGILLVDTPGLGSLAKRGARETLAYLPSCDLALLLIDAGATLNEEDIGTLRLLYEAGIPALVLLSKSDLLAEADLQQVSGYIQEHVKHELGLDVVIHPVSAQQTSSMMLDDFFERELVPRFDQARTLREASVARKIGALREAIKSALESNRDREKRGADQQGKLDTSEIESLLRVVTGEVGELSTDLDRTFREFGEKPNIVLDGAVDHAIEWLHNNSEKHLPPLQLSEWIHEVVWSFLQQPIEHMRSLGGQAVESLQKTAKEMGRVDAPSREDLELLLRDMPRFELAVLPRSISLSHWKFLGESMVRSRIKASLNESIGSLLKNELHLYGLALSQWSRQAVRKLEVLVNSYAEAYRVQIHRLSGTSEKVVNVDNLEEDLALLTNWNPATKTELTKTRA